jgi:site-specific DNA recombinase
LSIQGEEGKSLAAQKEEMHEFAEAQGWQVVAEFVDAGETGTSMERSGLQEALEAAEDGTFDVLLVHELSRLSRSLFDTLKIFEDLGQAGVGFVSIKDPDFNFSSATGRLFLSVLAALNQYYVDLLRMHTAKSKRERARRGLYNASITPYGYRHVGDADTPPEIVEEEAEAVRGLFERYATGRYSYIDLAEWINEAGYHTRSGRSFSKDTISEMLRNPFYKGKVVYKRGERSPDAWEVYGSSKI